MTQGATTPHHFECTDLERLLEPYLDGEFDADDRASLEAHLTRCTPCSDEVAGARAFRSELRARLREAMAPGSPAATAPDSLRRRISAALDAEEERSVPLWRRIFSPLPVAAMAACVAGVLVVFAGHRATDPLVEEAVRRHARDLPLELNAASIAPEVIPSMLASKLDFNPKPPPFKQQGMRLVGARHSQIRDWPAAYLKYETERGPVGLFILDDPKHKVAEEGHATRAGAATVWVMNMRGYNVAVWRQDEIVYSLVSDLDEADLVRLVETAQSPGR